jgi:hypothetical protein
MKGLEEHGDLVSRVLTNFEDQFNDVWLKHNQNVQ